MVSDLENKIIKENNFSTRRVGTVTLGISLIAVGIATITGLFYNKIQILTMAAKLSPLIIVMLGIEILIRYFINGGKEMRYDFLAGIICMGLILWCVVMSMGYMIFVHYIDFYKLY